MIAGLAGNVKGRDAGITCIGAGEADGLAKFVPKGDGLIDTQADVLAGSGFGGEDDGVQGGEGGLAVIGFGNEAIGGVVSHLVCSFVVRSIAGLVVEVKQEASLFRLGGQRGRESALEHGRFFASGSRRRWR